uniref:trimeric intracellular cation channel family protein n=1 Tax=Rhodococcus sp. MSC1_016 TaxID=2909266 RepID=UPI0027E107CC|nr:TRIC cation channel family protein [Rhodococcus sp. MSC1_016]
MPLWADLSAVAVGAMQGAMFAAKFHDRRIDLLGVVLVGTFTGLGGSLLRDGFLNVVPAALSNNWYLPTAVVAALAGMLLERLFTRLDPLVIALDALTVGLYAAIGMTKALGSGMPAIPSMFVGVAAAVGGSALRDIFLGLPIALMQVGSLYAAAAFAGAIALLIAVCSGGTSVLAAVLCTVVTTLLRLCAVKFGWTLPEQRSLEIKRTKRM